MTRPRRAAPRGFTLVELVVVIAIIAILAGAVVPIVVQPYIHERRSETLREMEAIEEAVMGRPDLGDWGFLSTMGRLPNNVGELFTQGSMTAVAWSTYGFPRGWNGPYIRVGTRSPTTDAWGQTYQIENPTADQWRIRSSGPNRVANDADDIVFPNDSNSYRSTGSVQVSFVSARGERLSLLEGGYIDSAELWLPNASTNGSGDTALSCSTETTGVCTFTNVPFGLRAVSVRLNNALTGCSPNCDIVRPVRVLKPFATEDVVLPIGSASEASCSLGDLTSFSSRSSCAATVRVPPQGSMTISISGAFGGLSGGSNCWVAPQAVWGGSFDPQNNFVSISQPHTGAIVSRSNQIAPAFASRTFVNTDSFAKDYEVGAQMVSVAGSCSFQNARLTVTRWMP